ncbi:MAG: DNA primase [Candidatus Aminicenantes bacterium]|nr:DNA primase [Candidatus Aminicenantes bacterium]
MDTYQLAKEEIKRAADIVELIGQYVQLKKAGLNHIGLCPFHGDKDPSFTVSQSKQRFHCFGCKKGGDVFSFWMEYHKVNFPQALKDLAEKYNIMLPEKKLTPAQKQELDLKEFLYRINNTAAGYYNYILEKTDNGKKGVEYFKKRTLSDDTVSLFKLGYALDEWDGLVKILSRKKISLEKAEKAGLLIPKKNGGYYDRFRGRVIFPIFDMEGRVSGFGGRVLDNSLPKYLNTPETPVFHKGELLYGLNTAFRHIRETGRVIIVEGYMDVLALNNHGFNGAVATLGTALTQAHIRKLKGFAKEIIVVFDSDAAGKNAALKSLPLFLNEGLTARVMSLPEGEDPDSFVNKKGLDAFLGFLDNSVPMFDFYIESKISGMESGVTGKIGILKEIIPILKEITSDLQRSVYVKHFCEKCGVSESVVLDEMERLRKNGGIRDIGGKRESDVKGSSVKSLKEYHLLNLLVHSPETAERILKDDFRLLVSDNEIVKIFDKLAEIYSFEKKIVPEQVLERMQECPEKEIFNEVMLSEPIYKGDSVRQAVMEFENRIQNIVLTNSINEAKNSGDLKKLNELIKLRKAI